MNIRKALKLGLLGPPGAGKGTQADLLARGLGCPHISTGDMFRALQQGSSALAQQIRGLISAGELVPDALVTKMTLERLGQPDAHDGFILDGFPRTLPQAVALQDSSYALDALIEFRAPREEIIKRLSGRRVCQSCKAIFHLSNLASSSSCSACGGELVLREDDHPESVALRLDIFENNFAPLIKFFEERGLLLSIDGCGEPDLVLKRILEGLQQLKP